MSDRCPVCDRDTCAQFLARSRGEDTSLFHPSVMLDCRRNAVDWRAEALRLRTELAETIVVRRNERGR